MVYRTIGGQRGVYVDGGMLIVDTFAATDRLPIERIKFDRIQVLDYKGSSPLRPAQRISGSSGMQEGLYYLRNGDRAYVSLRGSGSVLYIPAGPKQSVLLRTTKPSELTCALFKSAIHKIDQVHESIRPLLADCEEI